MVGVFGPFMWVREWTYQTPGIHHTLDRDNCMYMYAVIIWLPMVNPDSCILKLDYF